MTLFANSKNRQVGRCARGSRVRNPGTLGPLGGHKVHKMVKFRPRGMVDKREMEQAQLLKPPMNADARRCSAPLIGVDRRASAVPYPRRYEVCSLGIADCGFRIA